MNKRYISLSIILILTIGTLPALFGQTVANDCYQIKLIQSDTKILNSQDNPVRYDIPTVYYDCYYSLFIEGNIGCAECNPTWELAIIFKDLPQELSAFLDEYYDLENNEIIWTFDECGSVEEKIEDFPGTLLYFVDYIEVRNTGTCTMEYSWELFAKCPCEKGKQALYPKVDIEGFAVSGGATIIKDGKIVSAFNIAPGVQQTMIQVENRGFFTQKDARVRFIGLPEGVTVDLTPATQTIKAHNIGTYSATFTVGTNVPSGTYDIGMVAFSPNGIFDTIKIQLVVP